MKVLKSWATAALAAAAFSFAAAGAQGATAEPSPPAAQDKPAPSYNEYQRRALELYIGSMLDDDAFYERILGRGRADIPAFDTAKAEITDMYTDPVVLDWMLGNMARGADTKAVTQEIGPRMFKGLSRLDDDAALALLGSMGSVMGRLDDAQCEDFNRKRPGENPAAGLGRMLAMMKDNEVRGLLGGFHQALRSDILIKPLRPLPSRETAARATRALNAAVPGGIAGSGAGNGCEKAGRLMVGLNALQGDERTGAITLLMITVGMAAQREAAQR